MTTPNTPDATPPQVPPAAPLPRWQRWFGLRRREGKWLHWGLTRWGMVVAVMVLGGVGMAGFAEYSMQPAFCNSCHIMAPYYQAWHQSTHKDVPCVDCHFLPGFQNTMYGKFQASSQAVKYVTGTYGSKPHAEIHDESCLRSGCHEKRLLEGKVNWTIPIQQANVVLTPEAQAAAAGQPGKTVTIHFDHTPHLQQERRGKQLRCVSCHSQIVQGRHIVVTTDTCFLCHFKGLKHGRDDQTVGTCKGCHEAPKGEIRLSTGTYNHAEYLARGVLCENCHADSVKGDGAVPRQVCWNCHNQTAQISRYAETNAMHKAHVTDHKVECSSCHVQIEHGLKVGAPEEGPVGSSHLGFDSGTCGLCHEKTHLGPREMFRGVGGRGVPNMPSPMSRANVNCIACHTTKQNTALNADVVGQTFVATQERCDYCHGQKYKGELDNWRKSLTGQLDKAEIALAKARSEQAAHPVAPEVNLQVERLLDDAAFNIRFVKLGRGLHNINYATALLNVAIERAHQAQDLLNGKAVAAVP